MPVQLTDLVLIERDDTLYRATVAQLVALASGGGGGLVETGPAFTYSGGRLSQITYDSGNTKTFTYDGSGRLSRIDYVVGAITNRKDFGYNPDGSLASIDETVI